MPDIEFLKKQPWYRNPMVWLVIFFPMTAVVAGTITIIIAFKTDDGLVVDDYYKQGMQINMVIGHDKKAKELGLAAFVDANSKTGEILVSLSSDESFQLAPEITFKLIHRTLSGKDQTATLSRVGDGPDYRGYIKPPVGEGRWTIHVIAENTWRLKQNFTTKTADNILLNITS